MRPPRAIVHLDADAFFAAVEQASDPRLRGRPVAVGGERRGVIASASYEARRFGIGAAMPSARARRLCPKLVLLPGDFEKYERFSRWMFSYAYDFTPEVEVASIDEGYLDVSGAAGEPAAIAGTLRGAIGQALKISVSEGIGTSKLVSQIASKLHKPAALVQVPPGGERAFLEPLPNRWLPGVGPRAGARLDAAGLTHVRQIAATPAELLGLVVGGAAAQLRQFARGIDDRPVVPAREPAKSYGHQETFATDRTDAEFLLATLRQMADRLMARVRQDGHSIRTLTVKVRYHDLAEDQAGESLEEPTDLETDLYGRLPALLERAWKRRVSLRLLALRFSHVYAAWFGSALPLDRAAQRHEADRRLAEALDQLRRTHGRDVVMRGHDLLLRQGAEAEAPAASPARPVVIQVRSLPPPWAAGAVPRPPPRRAAGPAVPLAMHSHYSFLDSTLSPAAVVELARRHGMPAVALTDHANLHGAVEFVQAARQAGIKPILGAELRRGGEPLRLYVQNAAGYRNLCRLLTAWKKEDGPPAGGSAPAGWPLDEALTEGLLAVGRDRRLARLFPGRFYLAAGSGRQLPGAGEGLPAVAVLPVRYAAPEDRVRFDVVQSIRTCTLLRQPHPDKRLEGEFHFRPPAALREEFRAAPAVLERTRELAERCEFEFPFGPPQFPAYAAPDGSPPAAFLRRLVLEGLRQRYPGRHGRLRAQVEEELGIIQAVGYEEYFLVVWDLLQECRRQGIEWITRGSAADSLVCYCLGISDVCPIRFDLYFRRFLNRERMALNKLPDIDIDFAHDRKDDVVDLVFARHGAGHAAVVGGFSTFQARSAVAEVAKVLGMSEYHVRRFTEHFPWSGAQGLRERLAAHPECRDLPLDEEPYRSALEWAGFLDGVPRHPKMHPCGLVLSRQPMQELTPCFTSNKGYPTTHYDMDAVEAIGLVKIDILAQGGLAAMRDVRQALRARGIEVNLAACRVAADAGGPATPAPMLSPAPDGPGTEPWADPAVWALIAGGGARAVHHIESPAMVGLCRQSAVHDIDGLIAIVSVIRPGAANEQKKLRFTRRYQGLEPVAYPHPSLEAALRSTFGLVVYEEHILQICEAFAGLPPGRADVLRRALGKEKLEVIAAIQEEFFAAARARGHAGEKIAEVWDLVRGFAGYAFCKAHSTAYGVEAYQAAWLKCHFPAEFMAAVLTNGKGFYRPLVYVLECHRLGVKLRPPWVNAPGPGFRVERDPASPAAFIRVPVGYIKGLGEATQERLLTERARGEFASLRDFYLRVQPGPEEMELLLRAGALDGFGGSRPALFWEIQLLLERWGDARLAGQGWLLPPADATRLPPTALAQPSRLQRLRWELESFGFPASGHPLELYPDIAWDTYCPVHRLERFAGQEVALCGLVIEDRVHHQVTGEPMKFLTLADWTGMVETELFAQTYKSYGLATVRYPVLEVHARVEPFENGRGVTLRVLRAGRPRQRGGGGERRLKAEGRRTDGEGTRNKGEGG